MTAVATATPPVRTLDAPRLAPADAAVPALAGRGLSKHFADVVAADSIDLEAYRGEILAVLGENGAGKSTLMKMLYGYYHPDRGHIEIDGRSVRFHAPRSEERRVGKECRL